MPKEPTDKMRDLAKEWGEKNAQAARTPPPTQVSPASEIVFRDTETPRSRHARLREAPVRPDQANDNSRTKRE